MLFIKLRHFLWCAQVFLYEECPSLHELRSRMVSGLGVRWYWAQVLCSCLVLSGSSRAVVGQLVCLQLSAHSGSPNSPLLGILHLPLLIPNLVLVTEVCRQLVLLSNAQTSGLRKLVFMKKKYGFSFYSFREKKWVYPKGSEASE